MLIFVNTKRGDERHRSADPPLGALGDDVPVWSVLVLKADPDDLVTVVIPARDEETALPRCLDSILRQDEANLQVIVVDGASRDATADVVNEYARRDPRVELLHNSAGIIPRSLNLALGAARGRWLVRVDAHCTIPRDYVSRAVSHLKTGRWGGVGGRKDGVGRTSAGRAIAAVMESRFGVGGSKYHYGTRPEDVEHVPFGAYPTEVVRSLGGWDERLRVNQDFEFDHRVRKAGLRILFDPQLRIAWECRQSIPDFFAQYRRYGRGKVYVARLHPGSVRLRHLAAPALVASYATAPFIAMRRPRPTALFIALYPSALLVASLSTTRRLNDLKARRWVPAAFVAMHFGWGLGFWEGVAGVLSGRSTLRRSSSSANVTEGQRSAAIG